MLMEHSADDSHADVSGKKLRSLDLQTLYNQSPGLPLEQKQSQTDPLKRKHALVEDTCLVKKKSKKEFLLSSLASEKKSKKTWDEVSKGGSGSCCSDSSNVEVEEPGQVQKSNNANDFPEISLKPDADAIQIPKRRLDLVWRKKADVKRGLKLNLEGISRSDVTVAAELDGRLNGNVALNGNVFQSEEINGNLGQIGNYKGHSSGNGVKKVMHKNNFNDHKESRSNKLDLQKKDNGLLSSESSDSSSKKVKRLPKKRKGTGIEVQDRSKESKPVLDGCARSRDNSLNDDEENLEENAARMLSSHFDPSCTGFPSNNNNSRSLSTPSCPDVGSPGHSSQSGSETDTADRVLRPRDQHRQKGLFRKRRHFYEVSAGDMDPHWMLQRKTRVYWPLDQIWYYGKILGYDPDNYLHHIRYVDQEEEWINLRNERVKLLLFPSELPNNQERRGSASMERHARKGNSDMASQDDHRDNEYEPIISWLSRSSHRVKSVLSGSMKKQMSFKSLDEGRSSLSFLNKNEESTFVDVGSSQKDTNERFSDSSLLEISTGFGGGGPSMMESNSKSPIVYVRRQFRRKERDLGDGSGDRMSCLPVDHSGSVGSSTCHSDTSHSIKLSDSSAGWFHHNGLSGSADDLLPLKLSLPVVIKKVVRFQLTFPVFLVPYYSFGLENLSLFHAAQMLHYGSLVTLWPMVHLEILFIDNVVGLGFLLFEGCLKYAISFLFFILNVFHQPNQEQKHVDEQLPVTSIRFQFSMLGDVRKQLVFAFYNFIEVGTSKWNYLNHKLKDVCILSKQLPPPECTYGNIKALGYGFSHFLNTSALQGPSSLLGLQRKTGHLLLVDSNHWLIPMKSGQSSLHLLFPFWPHHLFFSTHILSCLWNGALHMPASRTKILFLCP